MVAWKSNLLNTVYVMMQSANRLFIQNTWHMHRNVCEFLWKYPFQMNRVPLTDLKSVLSGWFDDKNINVLCKCGFMHPYYCNLVNPWVYVLIWYHEYINKVLCNHVVCLLCIFASDNHTPRQSVSYLDPFLSSDTRLARKTSCCCCAIGLRRKLKIPRFPGERWGSDEAGEGLIESGE